MDSYELTTFFAVFWASIGIGVLLGLGIAAVLYVLIAVPLMRIFEHAGIEPWKAWVPFYSTYLWLQLGGVNGYWVLASLVPFGSYALAVFQYIAMYRQGFAYGKDSGFLVLGILLPVVWLFMIAYGGAPYEPWRIAARGLPGPFVGLGAVPPPVAGPYQAQSPPVA